MNSPNCDFHGEAPASNPKDIPRGVAKAAMEWLLMLHEASGPQKAAVAQRCIAWRRAAPEHEAAWNCIETFQQRLQHLDGETLRGVLDQPSSRRSVIKLGLGFAVSGMAGWIGLTQTPLRRMTADLHADVGRSRSVILEDGTRLALNSGSALDVDFADGRRHVILREGEALFHAPAGALPLQVTTRVGSIQTEQAHFSARLFDNFCRVSVFEGAVDVQPLFLPAPIRLTPGQQADMYVEHMGPILAASHEAIAWINGMIVASNMRLDAFLQELARYRHGHLSCDASVADLRVSGTYPLHDTDKILAALEHSLPVSVRSSTRYWVTVIAS
ncbi:MAG: FecR family protein [Pusillimonas sp.]